MTKHEKTARASAVTKPKPSKADLEFWAQLLGSLHQLTGAKVFERTGKVLPDVKIRKDLVFTDVVCQRSANDLLNSFTARQLEILKIRLHGQDGNPASDEQTAAFMSMNKKSVRDKENVIICGHGKFKNKLVWRLIAARLIDTRVGITKPYREKKPKLAAKPAAPAVFPKPAGGHAERASVSRKKRIKKLTKREAFLETNRYLNKIEDFDASTRERIRELIMSGLQRGYLTRSKITDSIPAQLASEEGVESIFDTLKEVGLQIFEDEPDKDELILMSSAENASADEDVEAKTEDALNRMTGMLRTTDTVRLYMREMSQRELLVRSKEINIAVQIENSLRLILFAMSKCPAVLDYLLETVPDQIKKYKKSNPKVPNKRLIDEDSQKLQFQGMVGLKEPKEVLHGKFEVEYDGESLARLFDDVERMSENMKPEISTKDEAFVPPGAAELKAQLFTTISKIKEFCTKRENALKAGDTVKAKQHQRVMERKLLSLRLVTPFVKRMAEVLIKHRARAAELQGEIRKMCSRNMRISTTLFDSTFPANSLNLEWIEDLGRKRRLGSSFETYKHEIVARQRKIINILKRLGLERIESLDKIVQDVHMFERRFQHINDEMVLSNLRLVVSIAKNYTNRGMQFLDLIQEGNIGLMKAVDKYEYRRGFKFSTYATWWIRQAITRALADQGRIIRVPVHMIESINRLNRAVRQLQQENGRDPDIDTIANKLEMSTEKVRKTMNVSKEPISMETPVGEDDAVIGDFIEDSESTDQAANLELKDSVAAVRGLLAKLSSRDRKVMEMRYGIGTDHQMNLDDIGMQLNLTRERVRQIEMKALRKLSQFESRRKFEKSMSD